MFSRSILIFIFCLACLGAGTVWVIENKTGMHILPRNMHIASYDSFNRLYLNGRSKVTSWWYQLKNGVSSSSAAEKKPADTRKIIKWQDKEGTWHFEYEKADPLEKPAN